MPKERRAGSKRKADKGAAMAVKVKRHRSRSAAAAHLPAAGPDQAVMQLSTASIKGRNLVQQWRSVVGRCALNKHLAMPAGAPSRLPCAPRLIPAILQPPPASWDCNILLCLQYVAISWH